MRKSTKVLLAGATVLGALAAGAGPAFASGNPVAITATVNQTISMTGPPATLTLAGDPGTTASGNVAYSWQQSGIWIVTGWLLVPVRSKCEASLYGRVGRLQKMPSGQGHG